MSYKICLAAVVGCFGFTQVSYATETIDNKFSHPFYFGITGGYGSTTWNGLVPPENQQNDAILLSTPNDVREGGGIWGFYAGYEFIPTFALEAYYTHFSDATVYFDPDSLVSFNNDGLTQITTKTESLGLMAKFMVMIPHTTVHAYSSAGAAEVHRQDMLNDCWQLSPTFGIGFNYNFTDRVMAEIGANYTGGYGESELDPSQDYVPFLYSVFLRLDYRFG